MARGEDEELPRNQPDELYPEWTTHPHAPESPAGVTPATLYPAWKSATPPRGALPPARVLPPSSPHDSRVGGRFDASPETLGPQTPSPEAPVGREARGALLTLGIGVVVLSLGGFYAYHRSHSPTVPVSPGTAPAAFSTDSTLEQAAKSRLKNNRTFGNLPVEIQVRDEVVIVSGRVPDRATREALLDYLRMTPSVRGIVDHTAIEQPGPQVR